VSQSLLMFREAVEATLATERNQAETARWTEGAFMLRGDRHAHTFCANCASGCAPIPSCARCGVQRAVHDRGRDRLLLLRCPIPRSRVDGLDGAWRRARAGRRHPTRPRVGEVIDYRTFCDGTRASAHAALRHADARRGRTRVRAGARAASHHGHGDRVLAPAGILGRVHWYALVPLHTFIFKGMTRTMTERVKALPDRASASAA
jgi:hypothetical protein